MGFVENILKHRQSEHDEIFYELASSLRNLLEVHTPSGDPARAEEENEAVYRGRISLRIAMQYFQSIDWFADHDEEEEEVVTEQV